MKCVEFPHSRNVVSSAAFSNSLEDDEKSQEKSPGRQQYSYTEREGERVRPKNRGSSMYSYEYIYCPTYTWTGKTRESRADSVVNLQFAPSRFSFPRVFSKSFGSKERISPFSFFKPLVTSPDRKQRADNSLTRSSPLVSLHQWFKMKEPEL